MRSVKRVVRVARLEEGRDEEEAVKFQPSYLCLEGLGDLGWGHCTVSLAVTIKRLVHPLVLSGNVAVFQPDFTVVALEGRSPQVPDDERSPRESEGQASAI